MSYLSLRGLVRSVLHQEEGTNRKTGEVYPERWQVQLEVENVTQSGDTKFEILTLSTDRPEHFTDKLGKKILVPVGVFASGKSCVFYIPKAKGQSVPSVPVVAA